MILVFMALLFVMVGIAVFGSISDKKKQQVAKKERVEREELAKTKISEIFIKLYLISSWLQKQQKEFKVSVGKYTKSDLNIIANQKIKDILYSKDLIEIYKSDDRKLELKPVIDQLIKAKPLKWEEEAFEAINIIKGKYQLYTLDNQELLNKIKKELKFEKIKEIKIINIKEMKIKKVKEIKNEKEPNS